MPQMLKFKLTFQPEVITLLVRSLWQGAGTQRVSDFSAHVKNFVTLGGKKRTL